MAQIPKNELRGGKENLARIGAVEQADKVLDSHADPNCKKCKGTGQITTPDRKSGGHYCPCTFRTNS